MVSRKALIVMTVMVAIGLMGPIGFIASQGAKNETLPEDDLVAPPVSITPIDYLIANATGNVTGVTPSIITSATSDYGLTATIEEKIRGIDGVKNVTITREDNPGTEGLYKYAIEIESSLGETERVSYVLPKVVEELTFGAMAMRAEVELPRIVNASSRTSVREYSTDGAFIDAFVYPFTMPGDESEFSLEISDSSSGKHIVAIEVPRLYFPPSESYTGESTAEIIEYAGNTATVSLPTTISTDGGDFDITGFEVLENEDIGEGHSIGESIPVNVTVMTVFGYLESVFLA